ncbi:GerW family sporulation protein [Natribaculum luteum]|uniref:GerW family sporulation protein n=1 Tax=Natribaculum luteum TaxID=1586232 RepID=A0ABD5NY81_9EURY|nr:spore germination protein GerW family protein [Natribaculum luteum]
MTLRSLETVAERFSGSVAVRTAFGEPIDVGDRTIVPVARTACGFGGGFDGGRPESDEESAIPSNRDAGGYGGGFVVRPLGVIEITDDGTRFVRVEDRRRLFATLLVGYLVGWVIGRR